MKDLVLRLATLANCTKSLNTAWLVIHNPCLKHLREIALTEHVDRLKAGGSTPQEEECCCKQRFVVIVA